MPKSAAGIAILLTLITGMIVGQLHLVAGNRVVAPPVGVQTPADPHIATAFYESLNQLIRTGDASGVRKLVAYRFVDHSPFRPEPGSTETLLRYFQGLHAATPDALLQVEDVTTDGTLIAVRLQLVGAGDLTVAGLPVLSPAADSVELLRIEEEKIVERWAGALLPPLADTVGSLFIRSDAAKLREPRLERVVLLPNAEFSINDHLGTILRVDTGVLSFTRTEPGVATALQPGNDHSAPAEDSRVLSAGDSMSIQPMRSFLIRNTGRDVATLIWLSIREVGSGTHPSPWDDGVSASPGIEVSMLAGGVPIRTGQGPFEVVIDRMVAPPGTSIPLHRSGEFEMLLVESGNIDVALQNKFVLSVTSMGSLRSRKDSYRLDAGNGISAPFSVDLEYLTTGDEMTVLWVVTVR